MFSRSTYVVACIGLSLLFMAKHYSIVCMYHMLVIAEGSGPGIVPDSELVADEYFLNK